MANTTDFIGAVYDQLAKLLNITDTTPSIIMAMAWPGFSLSPEDFRRSDAPHGPYDPEVATETFSRLANIAPVLNKTHYENSGFEIDNLYEILISSAIPAGVTPDTIATNPINKMFSDAQYELLQARRGIYDDPNAFYHPCKATPVDWYDEAAAQLWPTFNMKSTDVKPASPTSAFVKAGGLTLANRGVWRLKPTPANGSAIKTGVQHALVTKAQSGPLVLPAAPLAVAAVSTARVLPAATSTRIPVGADLLRAGTVVSRESFAVARTKTVFTGKATPSNLFTNASLGEKAKTIDLAQQRMGLAGLNVANRFVLKDLIDQQLPARPASSTDGFSISFRYSRVNIDRAWLNLALLGTRNWYMFGTPAGEYSTGSDTNNPGMFPLLPTSFIAIRDLRITANWSTQDKQNLTNAASFGFFDIRGSTLNSNTLEVKGLQILCWISRLMTQLPPMPPP